MESSSDKMNSLRRAIVNASVSASEGHIPSALSILDILWVLYYRILNITPDNFQDPNRDHFVLSKGHASLGLYVVLIEKGFFSSDEMRRFARFDSIWVVILTPTKSRG